MQWAHLGYVGSAIFLLAHFLLSNKFIKPELRYQALQITGALCLGTSALMEGFGPTVVLESFWLLVSVFAVAGFLRKRKNTPA